ncbi:MAG: hypothetical protein APF81_15475 [Desulfosporosinus sp. BRH_c37]|nr:MAG: hypothetical protein APF81_15475 [Desulfosporosinus sp. BRH_c37]
MAALAKRPTLDFEDALRVILMNSLQEDENTVWQNIVKCESVDGFWKLTEKYYDYLAKEKSLQGLFTLFIINSLCSVLNRTLPPEWQGLVSTKQANCVVFLDHFMHHSVDSKVYDKLTEEIEADLHLGEYLEQWDIQDYEQVDLFQAVDRSIIHKLINSLLIGSEEFTQYREIISLRKTKHYYPEFENYYAALSWAIEMYAFKKKYIAGIPERDALAFFEAYTKEYFIMDQAYSSGRRKILQSSVNDSEVVLLNDLISMTRIELRNTFKGKNVVYIYQNVIDSVGDKGDESKTFQAVEQAFEEIEGAIRNINKNLTEANIYITSDHGFASSMSLIFKD